MSKAGSDTQTLVADVLHRYARAIDERDWTLLRSCFTEDVEAEYDGAQIWHSASDVTTFMQRSHEPFGKTLHRLTNITVTNEKDQVQARTYVDALLMAKDGGSGQRVVGVYDDRLVTREGEWKIAYRRFTMVHMDSVTSRRGRQ